MDVTGRRDVSFEAAERHLQAIRDVALTMNGKDLSIAAAERHLAAHLARQRSERERQEVGYLDPARGSDVSFDAAERELADQLSRQRQSKEAYIVSQGRRAQAQRIASTPEALIQRRLEMLRSGRLQDSSAAPGHSGRPAGNPEASWFSTPNAHGLPQRRPEPHFSEVPVTLSSGDEFEPAKVELCQDKISLLIGMGANLPPSAIECASKVQQRLVREEAEMERQMGCVIDSVPGCRREMAAHALVQHNWDLDAAAMWCRNHVPQQCTELEWTSMTPLPGQSRHERAAQKAAAERFRHEEKWHNQWSEHTTFRPRPFSVPMPANRFEMTPKKLETLVQPKEAVDAFGCDWL